VNRLRIAQATPSPALLAAAIAFAVSLAGAHAAAALGSAPSQDQSLTDANAALQSGEADKALALLAQFPQSGPGAAQAQNLLCRVRLTLNEWDAAAASCEQAVHLDAENSGYHLWLGRALGEKASRASFLTAFSLAKRTRAEFEEAVHLDPSNVQALSDLGDFYRQAPGAVGGGIDKAEGIVPELEKIDPAGADELRGRIADQRKNFSVAESEYKKMTTAGPHPSRGWSALASFYSRQKRFQDMEAAIHNAMAAALRDKQESVALYDGAGLLIEAKRNPTLAATLLDDYLAAPSKTEDAPAFVAHLRLARLKAQLGDAAAAERERTAALDLAHEYKPAQDFKPQNQTSQ
jgi:tetratricopeptide (TPR) repeat protein